MLRRHREGEGNKFISVQLKMPLRTSKRNCLSNKQQHLRVRSPGQACREARILRPAAEVKAKVQEEAKMAHGEPREAGQRKDEPREFQVFNQ